MKKSLRILLILILLIIVLITIYYFIESNKHEVEMQEYIPEQEITEEQERKTIITLYYSEKETGELMPEARLIDAKELLENPYLKLLTLLLETPKNEKLDKIMPENIKIDSVNISNGIVKINFISTEMENINKNKENFIKSIEKTLTQLNEVNSIEILINEEVFI